MRSDGNNAKRVNGNANANEKPSIPIDGARISPESATETSMKPMIGPVQENETSTSVNAMRKMLRRPVVLPAFSSTLFVHDDGNVSSKPPRNDAPKATSIRKKKMLNTALVERAFNAPAPKISVTQIPSTR